MNTPRFPSPPPLANEMQRLTTSLALLFFGCVASADRPNVLLIIADDASQDSFGVYGSTDISTPAFDDIARQGVLFKNAFNCNPKCAPARAALLVGRYSWQLEESCNHFSFLADKWQFYPYLLEQAGYSIGYTGKGWGPGTWHGYNASRESTKDNPAGHPFNELKNKPPYAGINSNDYSSNFEAFLTQVPDDTPFCFWLGTKEPHRFYEHDSWKADGRDLTKVRVPGFFPDNETVRGDLADYAIEVEWFDKHIGQAMAHLKKSGKHENTIVIVTSDHGMPFPRIKGQVYDAGFRVPMAVSWPGKIPAGRIVDDFITFPDVAPTLMDLVGAPTGPQMTGKSFKRQLFSKQSGIIDRNRNHTLLGKERHDIGRTDGEMRSVGYPVRAIRNSQYLYARNFLPNRWPVGDPEYGFRNCDNSPTKQYLMELEVGSPERRYFEMSFGKRPLEELYDVVADPDCLNNLASDPMHAETCRRLWKQLQEELTAQGDPRILGKGDIFDFYPNANIRAQQKLYGDPMFDPVSEFEMRYGK